MASLQQALDELTTVSRRLLADGEPLLAARLLDEQAAIWTRLGDPVRAIHLLSRSQELFERRLRQAPDDAMVVEELAQTNHLMTRLPLHARIRRGREQDAYAIALDHALAAERAYRELGRSREVAQVWETMGRPELGQGRTETAREHLTAALERQRQLGDVTGLARTSAALAELLVAAGRLEEAAGLLTDSIALNLRKGSPIGLAFNRRAFEALARAARAQNFQTAGVRAALAQVESVLAQAEAVLGRLALPDEGDTGR